MSSSFSASEPATPVIPVTAGAIATAPVDLSEWQRFLQSQPLNAEAIASLDEPACDLDATPSASMWRLLGQTLGSLSSSWPLGLLAGAVAAGNLTLLAFDHLLTLPTEPDCDAWASLDLARDQLTCWQTAIANGDTQAKQMALAEVSRWPVSHPLFSEGQNLLEDWSHTALQEAQQAATDDNWATAIALVAQVPGQSPHFQAAQALQAQLQTQQQKLAQALNTQAQSALAVADWATAYQALSQLQQLDHAAVPLDSPQQLAQQITAEREAVRLWNEAQRLWDSGLVTNRDTAIAIAYQIDSRTHRWQAIQPVVSRWREAQLTLAQTDTAPTATPMSPPQLVSFPYQPHFSGSLQPVQY
ncbi:hypothetical protein [Halomicronema sp. CCY15110]|uniref:hypothetical protein n=1 Tax=Halomicronema sp. CCY15110 TaxID=2767773 RepID=UPI0019528755|nr:hypothetical protein [Halomicronema sp. CCY15110]